MATLAEIADTVADMMSRSDLTTQIKREIPNAVRRLNREMSHVTEVRNLTFETVPGEAFYGTLSIVGGEGYDPAAWSPGVIDVRDVQKIVHMRKSPGITELDEPMMFVPYRRFEAYREGTTSGGDPFWYTRYGARIGVYPTPSVVLTIQISAHVKPTVPSGDASTSIWFDEAPEMVEAMTAARVYRKYVQDEERAQKFDAIASAERTAIYGESARLSGSGVLAVRD